MHGRPSFLSTSAKRESDVVVVGVRRGARGVGVGLYSDADELGRRGSKGRLIVGCKIATHLLPLPERTGAALDNDDDHPSRTRMLKGTAGRHGCRPDIFENPREES